MIALIKLFLPLLVLIITLGCNGGKVEQNKKTLSLIKEIPTSAWQKLSEKKIFFGHQSVGFNIMDGIKDVMRENPGIKLRVVETAHPGEYDFPIFGHARVGKNEDPRSKCDAFVDYMEKGLGDKVDLAFFKFCFVDITAKTDVERLFDDYSAAMTSLKKKYPKTTFLHATVPLTTVQGGMKAWVKGIIGRPIDGYDDNIKKEQFNVRLRNEFQGKEPIFDLAAIESTLPDGARVTFKQGGKMYYALSPNYTTDGGHLNDVGRRVVAEQLLIQLANLSNQNP